MSDRLPYEEQLAQQWNDLPLPDENMAWADMKRRLDEDDEGGIIPVWLRSCGLWGLLTVILLGLGWWLIRPEKWWNKKEVTEKVKSVSQKEKSNPDKKTINPDDTIQIINNTRKDSRKDISKDTPDETFSQNIHKEQKSPSLKKEGNISVQVTSGQSKKKRTYTRQQVIKKSAEKNNPPGDRVAKKQIDQRTSQKGDDKMDISLQPGIKNNHPAEPANKSVVTAMDSLVIPPGSIAKTDSARKVSADSVLEKIPEQIAKKENDQKKDSSKRGKISFSAGVAMQQLLPVAGQKLTPYNSLGRKGSLADYIPSVYLRMYKDDKWFLQAEFKYGAPQYNKELLYQDNVKVDFVGMDTITTATSAKLKKTFYHQLPLTFNYFILPNWSIGTGIIWNKFVSAVSEQDVFRQINTGPTDTLVIDGIMRDTNTSVFSKSYFHTVIETQYRWKRFSFGVRYAFGLQPYIKFTLPGGAQQQEKNKSLQVFLRYELWRSKKK